MTPEPEPELIKAGVPIGEHDFEICGDHGIDCCRICRDFPEDHEYILTGGERMLVTEWKLARG